MTSPVRVALASVAFVLSSLLVTTGCSKAPPPAAPPAAKPAAPAEEKPATPAPAPTTETPAVPEPAEPPAQPEPAPPVAAADDDEKVLAALIETLATTGDSRIRVITIDDIATRHAGAKPAIPALEKALDDAEPRVRWHAARALGLIGKDATSSIPALLKLLGDQDPIAITQAAAAIGHIRIDDDRDPLPEADAAAYASSVDPLLDLSVHPDARVRRAAIRSLKRLSKSSDELAGRVIQALGDADPVAVMPALHTLADMEEDAIPFLVRALADPKSRYWAAVTLAEIGPEAAPAAEPLAKLAADGPIEDRVQAILALAAIGEPAAAGAPACLAALGSEDASLRYVGAFALGRLKAKAASEQLARAAADEDEFLALLASWARTEIDPADEKLRDEALGRLRAALESPQPDFRKAAIEGLSDLSPRLDPAERRELATLFAGQLDSGDPGVGLAAGGALIRLGGDAVDALRARLSLPASRAEAMEILTEIGTAAKPALAEMVAGLADADPVYRGDCALALAALGTEAAPAVEPLGAFLADESLESGTRATAAFALGRIGPPAAAAESALRKLADSDDEMLATVAVWATLKIKPEDRTLFDAAIPKLRHALRQDREMVRLEAAVALGEIGPPAATAIPMLEMLAEEDPVKAVRQAAAEALDKIRPAN